MLLEVFINVVAEYKAGSTVDELKTAIKAAYEKTLLPFHGWMLQQTFSVSRMGGIRRGCNANWSRQPLGGVGGGGAPAPAAGWVH